MKPLRAGLPAALSLLAAISMSGCSDARQDAAQRLPGDSPPPALALRATVPHGTMYADSALPVRVQLTSPLARQEARLASRALEAGKAPAHPPHHYVDRVPADWAEHIALTLVRVWPDGRRETVTAPGTWSQWRIAHLDTASSAAGTPKRAGAVRIGDPIEEWLAPPAAAQLAPGRYALDVQWHGADAVDAAWLDSAGLLRAPEVAFEVRIPSHADERAEHAQRLAQEEFQAGRYEEARASAREALRLDPTRALDPERIDTYLVIARASLALGDAATAADTYRMLLRRLPPPEASDLAVALEQRLATLSRQDRD